MTEEKFMSLMRQHKSIMYHAHYSYARDIDQQDVFQEIFYHVWRSIGTFKNSGKFSTWFYSVCKFVCTNLARRKSVRPKMVFLDEDLIDNIVYTTQVLSKIKDGIRYEVVVGQLEEADKSFFMMYMDGLSFKEMALQIGIDENAYA